MNLFNMVLYEPYNVTVCSLDFIPVIEGGTCDPSHKEEYVPLCHSDHAC